MLTVDYPALPSYFHGKDAIVRTYSFWTTLKCFFKYQCYAYPVVYTDGLLSQVVSDGENRTPWGIAIGDYVIAIHAPKEEMSPSEARQYNKTIVFAAHAADSMDISVLRYIRMHVKTFNRMLKQLGGDPFEKGLYLSSSYSGSRPIGIDFASGHNALYYIDEKAEEKILCRPAVDLSDLY